jgi:hypothetical protein
MNYIEYVKQKKEKEGLKDIKNKNIEKSHIDETDSAYW